MRIERNAGWSTDRLLGGRLTIEQPAHGYRVAIDPLLLQAAVQPAPNDLVLDAGAGVGGAILALARRSPSGHAVGLEHQPPLAAAMARNARRNGLADRVEAVCGDIANPPFASGAFDVVMTNPPFGDAATMTMPATDLGRAARVLSDTSLGGWLSACCALVRSGGRIVVIHRADRTAQLLAGLQGRAGRVRLLPLWPKQGRPAKRVLVEARVGQNGPLAILPGLVLHREDGHFTDRAAAILAGADGIDWECG
ncbi:MAG: methyltransferase domain-containing protein [Pseudomonadota bacterium]